MKKSWITNARHVDCWWIDYKGSALRIAVVIMTIAATVWLTYEFYRLLWQPKQIGFYKVHPGAIDLKILHDKVARWSSGKPLGGSVYPPASYVMLWPLLGWLKVQKAVWLWAATSVVALGWLVSLVVRKSGAETVLERIFVGLIPLSMYAAGATIGNGQLTVHLMPMLLAGLLFVQQRKNTWGRDVLGSALILASLVKPSVTAPFFWIAVFVPGRLRPALLVVAGYIILTLFAIFFPTTHAPPVPKGESPDVPSLTVQKPAEPTHIRPTRLINNFLRAGAGAAVKAGESNMHIWMGAVGLNKWVLHASMVVLALLGLWIYIYRRVDMWLLMGVAAIVARFWIYHRWYDDLLILLPMIALFRITRQKSDADNCDMVSGVLLGITLLIMIAPGGLYLLAPPWNMIYVHFQTIIWFIVLIFLVRCASKEKAKNAIPL